MKEKWKDIKGYEGAYQISSLGKVKSLSRTARIGYNFFRKMIEKILKASIDGAGYYQIRLSINRTVKSYRIHRLIAEHFILNPRMNVCINHKDGNKLNNKIDNLEWCTYSENMIHSLEKGLRKPPTNESHGMAKLNRFQVQRIRLIKEIMPKITKKALGKLFNMSEGGISGILGYKVWKKI